MMKYKQHGGTFLGLIIGVLFGLAVALAVAVYITKVPVSFVNKGQVHNATHDAQEIQKNKNWNPNVPLYGKNPAKPASSAASDTVPVVTATVAATTTATVAVATPPKIDKIDPRQAMISDPLGELAKAKADAAPAAELFSYFIQAGAFRSADEAEQQRAKLSLMGLQAKVSEKEQAGRSVFRVRMGRMIHEMKPKKYAASLTGQG